MFFWCQFSWNIFLDPVAFSVLFNYLWPHGLQHARLPCPSLSPRVCSHSRPLNRYCHPTVSSSVVPFSCLQSFPASRSFLRSQFFMSGGQSIWSFSFSISPSNEYSWLISFRIDWFYLLAVWAILKNFLQYHSSKASILWLNLLYGPTLTSTHDYWKNHSFDYTDFFQKSDFSNF